MHLDTKESMKLNKLIHWVKKELLSDEAQKDDPVPLFIIDEVTVEINFVLTGEGEGGFDLRVVRAGAKVGEERIQKAVVHMRPIVPYEDLKARLAEEHLVELEEVAARALIKGRAWSGEDIPERE
ncbi:MAG: hypothetical protein GF309_01050 [Candidatus Lokiarchaeota archaeon]|nr:hypothetical protein [Candidatus Lokiarchaeota archaeon]